MIASSSRGLRLRRRFVAVGVILIFAFAASAVIDIWRSYRYSLAAIDRELGNLSKALAEEAARSFQALEVLLRDIGSWHQANHDKITPEQASATLANFETGLPVEGLYITDAQGALLYSSRPLPPDIVSAQDRALTFIDDRPVVVMSREVQTGGRFAGKVSTLVDLAEFQQLYDAIELTAGNTIGLLRDDGILLARRPPTPDAIGKTFPELSQARDAQAARKQEATLMVSPLDGRPRFVAVASVRNFPFLVMTTRDETVALGPWSEQAVHSAVRTVVLSLLGALVIAALVRQLARADAGEQALREQAALLDLTRDTVFVRDMNDVITYWNRGAEDVYGWSKPEALGRKSHELMQTVFPAPLEEIHAVLSHTGYWEGELVHTRRDGTSVIVASRWSLQRDDNGRPRAVLETNNDITGRKHAEAEKARLEAELRRSQKMEAIGTLAGGIAHDFNNILGAILGYGELAQRKAGEGSAIRDPLDQVMQAGNRGKRLVEHILAFSRSGVGERVPVHVQSVVEETLEILTASLTGGVRLEKTLRGADAAVVGDATQLHQVTMNLCTNAVQAMPEGGVLTVTLDRVEIADRRMLSHGTLPPGAYVRLQVSDTGSGIPPTVLERIFDPFFTTKGVGEGTGLGLSLVHGIVADFGGAIDVSTREGAGTTFAVWLPASGETAAPLADAAGALPHGNGEAVMVVDDERPLVALAEETLAELGYDPAGFDSSLAALAAFRAEPQRYDLVLTDETMPELTGTELAREIRQLRADVPIVLMSGYSGPHLTERAHAAGVCDILRKPLVGRDIAESLARALPERA
jgi:PAS domain S-box-containing protein